MILLFGIPSEPPVELLHHRLLDLGAPVAVLNQREFDRISLTGTVAAGRIEGRLRIGDASFELDQIQAVYARPMDDRLLPELDGEPPESPRRRRCRALHDGLVSWLDVAPGRIVNRFREMGSNGSKPYQAQLIAQSGFDVPDTLVTNDPDLVRAFRERHRRLIYKSTSAARSIVHELDETDLRRLDAVRGCPVQFQELVPGFDVRVHVVADVAIATRVDSRATDYRYDDHGDGGARVTTFELPAEIESRSCELAARLGLAFAGLDLRFAPDGRVICFEANPSPAYSYYEEHTDQPISLTLARFLSNA